MTETSPLEQEFITRLIQLSPDTPEPVREWKFHPRRRWSIDFAWVSQRVAVEIEGGTYSGGRHSRGAGYAADCEKYNALALDGWTLLRYTGDMLHNNPSLVVYEVNRALERSQLMQDSQQHMLSEITHLRAAVRGSGGAT